MGVKKMAIKIYLSPSAHEYDNRTQCHQPCSENTHCNEYMDIVERRLKDCGFEVMRGDKALTGKTAMQTRVKDANRWKADLYYVAHSNAGGGHYSMTMCWNNNASKEKANILHKYRKCINHKVVTNTELYEIRATAMTCLYDELFFHDDTLDCQWFHSIGMDALAEETVHAICDMFGVVYKTPVIEQPKPQQRKIYRVQVGAYADPENARRTLEKLKSAGFDGFIVEGVL